MRKTVRGSISKRAHKAYHRETQVVNRREGEHEGMHVTHLESMHSDSSEKQQVMPKVNEFSYE